MLRLHSRLRVIVRWRADFDRNVHKKHVYFQLADKEEGEDRARAEVTIVLFASARERIERRLAEAAEPFQLRDGLRIRVRVRVDV